MRRPPGIDHTIDLLAGAGGSGRTVINARLPYRSDFRFAGPMRGYYGQMSIHNDVHVWQRPKERVADDRATS